MAQFREDIANRPQQPTDPDNEAITTSNSTSVNALRRWCMAIS
jgi:hypothetical protein